MIEGFENKEAFARFNYIIDIVRGNNIPIQWKLLPQTEKDIYLRESEIAEYVITEDDCDDLEQFIMGKSK